MDEANSFPLAAPVLLNLLKIADPKVKRGGPLTTNQILAAYFTEEGIEWNFIPPKGPTYGRSLGGGHKVSEEMSPQASTGKGPDSPTRSLKQ
ncbi:hypothetical protein TNCV_3292321 [Trichonephila clavipes]|nr:hypothetical protein TNCV_3292321 [Trichonephila clavipes]